MKILYVMLLSVLFSGTLFACPSIAGSGSTLNYDSNTLYTPQSHQVIAGGTENLSNCYDLPGTGWVALSPDFELNYQQTNKPSRELELRVDSKCDTVILINDPAGNWFHDDDSNGNQDAKIRFTTAPSGIYDVWIGTYDGDYCDSQVTFETF
jgi:hypothetical protein